MKSLSRLLGCAAFIVATTSLQASPISGSVNFTGGVLGGWAVQFTSSNPLVELQQLTITLPATYGFDTQGGGFGYLLSQDFQQTGGAATVASLTPGTTAGRDGSGFLIIDFSNFLAANGPFTFNIDVDGTCSNLLCFIALGAPASLVDGSEIAGTSLQLTFGGSGLDQLVLTTSLVNQGGNNASALFSGDITESQQALPEDVVPEPATYAMMGLGMSALALVNRKRKA